MSASMTIWGGDGPPEPNNPKSAQRFLLSEPGSHPDPDMNRELEAQHQPESLGTPGSSSKHF